MYTAYWCPHCHEQKELFGKEASAKLGLVECAADGQNSQKPLCDTKAIEGFPSWEINGKLDSGVKSLAELARLSGYSGPVP
jgi:glutaredoxin